jgi:hypothetical protein
MLKRRFKSSPRNSDAFGLAPVIRGRGPAVEEARSVADEYVFIDEWDVDAPQEALFDALAGCAHLSGVVAARVSPGRGRL